MSRRAADFDVVVVGGGLTGLVFAGLLARQVAEIRPRVRIALVEGQPPPRAEQDAPLDLRVSALAPASQMLLAGLDWWDALPAGRVSPYQSMCVWQASGQADGERSIRFDAAELGEPNLGYIVENLAIRQTGWETLLAAEQVELLTGGFPTALTEDSHACTLGFADGREISARLIVGADGARSWVRSQFAVGVREHDYEQSGLVTHIATARAHGSTAWQRFLADGPVALLPLADGRSSLVWSCPRARATELREMAAASFEAELEAALDGVLGRVECTTDRVSFPLAMAAAERYSGTRFALIGDAAHRVHPLAGQGANLGLLDAAALAASLAQHLRLPAADAGDPVALRRYERARKGDNLLTMQMMNLLNRVFASSAGALAGTGMETVSRVTGLKNSLARYAMGYGRELPAAMRPSS